MTGEVLLEQLRLMFPATFVRGERLGASLEGDAIEAGLGDREGGASFDLLQLEHDESGGLLRVVDARLDRERVPAKGEDAVGLDAVDRDSNALPLWGS